MPLTMPSIPSVHDQADVARWNLALIQVTAEGRCTFVSRRWCELTGIPPEQALDLGWSRCLHPEDRERVLSSYGTGTSRGHETAQEFRILNGGRQRWMHSETQRTHDDTGSPSGYLSIFTDITRRVSSEQRFRLLFEQSSEPHLFLDDRGVVIDCNRAVLLLLGLDDITQLRGTYLLANAPPTQADGRASREAGGATLALCVLRGSHRFEWTLQRASGVQVPVEVAASCILLDDARVILAVVRDLTEQKTAEREILASREAALEALRAKAQFLANMSHEIRTPMNGVLGMLDLLHASRLSAAQRDYLAAARTSAQNLLSIIDDILDFSKLEATKLRVETIPLALEPILRDSLRTVAAKAHQKDLELVLELGAAVPERISGDPVRLRQVLTNLVGNAVKFTDAGEVVLSVTLVPDASGSAAPRLRFSVQDSGIGIASEDLERVVESFTQADPSTTRRYGGTGLGLSISRELIALMGGKLHVVSELHVGSTFYFELPLAALPEAAPPPADTEEPRVALVVLRHARARRALCALLGELGFDADVADTFEQALSLLAADPAGYHAVLLEERDNERSSALTRRLHALRAAFVGTVVLLRPFATTSGAREDDPDFIRILRKPVMPSELRAALRTPRAEDARRASAPPAPSARPLYVLLVEDQAINAFYAQEVLSRLGHEVVHAMTAAEAIAACAAQPFDLVLMDVHMPDMDGQEATRRIRASERARGAPRVPIVALTALTMHEDLEACLASGMDAVLSKPFSGDALHAVITETTGNRAAPAEPPRANTTSPHAYDHAELLARVGGRHELVAELTHGFLSTIDQTMLALNGSVAADDLDAVRVHAHTLKGTVDLMCAEDAASLATALERAARERRSEALLPLLGSLNAAVAQLCAALRTQLAQRPV